MGISKRNVMMATVRRCPNCSGGALSKIGMYYRCLDCHSLFKIVSTGYNSREVTIEEVYNNDATSTVE